MQPQHVVSHPPARKAGPHRPGGGLDVEQAEAALVEHYPRLVRLAYLLLPSAPDRGRRVLAAHAVTQRALPRGRTPSSVIPAQAHGREGDPGYAVVRMRIVRAAMEAGGRRPLHRAVRLPPLLPQVWGLRLFPRSGGAGELALEQRLAALSPAGRAAYVLRGLERLPDDEVREVLESAGVENPYTAIREADKVPVQYTLLDSPEFDPCALQARPTDLMRRRQHTRAALAAAAAAAICAALVLTPGEGWGPDGAAAPPHAGNPAARAALDPGELSRAAPAAWRTSARLDFSVWPARGALAGDERLLRRALAVWARPGRTVQVSATTGTPSGGPAGPPRLLYAGEVDGARVVLLHDGLRVVRYAEPSAGAGGAALDLARVDGAEDVTASAVVVGRSDGNVRYLLAPWVTKAAGRDLMGGGDGTRRTLLDIGPDGVTSPLAGPVRQRPGACTAWNALELTGADGRRMVTDLGELTPAALTVGEPGDAPADFGPRSRQAWRPLACSLATMRGQGVRSVNAWRFAEQPLPDGTGTAAWVCTRSETWRGEGVQVLAQFRPPGVEAAAVTAKAADATACGARDPQVVAGVLWKAGGGDWHLLAAGGPRTASITASGGVRAEAEGRFLSTPAEQGARADLRATLSDGREVTGLG
ncbi:MULTISPECIES: hypothetical protein [Streptomyces]|uniref:DNA-directed RNA polymerase specialized sigma24 family protein n=1 Tax=Streptomyces chilikensis TaxID=1194079 RepID=A0ABV3EUB3_9ACTN|nr:MULTISPECIES: hypothetical protein [Streptomyces]MDH6227277.1 hypothetical protein [Streptomyces sp. MJP52]